MSEPVKLCKNCRWLVPYEVSDSFLRLALARCAKSVTLMNPVTGEETHRFAQNEREPDHACGPDAKLYEPIPVAA